jgi:hypothetical protein
MMASFESPALMIEDDDIFLLPGEMIEDDGILEFPA